MQKWRKRLIDKGDLKTRDSSCQQEGHEWLRMQRSQVLKGSPVVIGIWEDLSLLMQRHLRCQPFPLLGPVLRSEKTPPEGYQLITSDETGSLRLISEILHLRLRHHR